MSADVDRTVIRVTPSSCRSPHEHTEKLFSERVVKVWNSLLPSIVNFSSLATFRISLNKISLEINNINAFSVCVLCANSHCITVILSFIVSFYFVLLFIMHMFVVLILPAYKWLPLFAADVKIKFLTKLFIFSNIRLTNECRQCCCF